MASSISQALRERWKPEYDRSGAALGLRTHFRQALDACELIAARNDAIQKDARLSDSGRRMALHEYAATEAPTIAKASRAVAIAAKMLNARRSLLEPKIEDTVTQALLRQEMRTILRQQTPLAALAMAFEDNAPKALIEAVLEAPQMLHGIPQAGIDELREAVIQRNGGPELASLTQDAEALELARMAVQSGMDALGDVAGFSRIGFDKKLPPAFDTWLETVAPADSEEAKESDASFAAATAESLIAAAAELPFDARVKITRALIDGNVQELKSA